MKKIFNIMLVLSVILTMAACTPDKPAEDETVQQGQEVQQDQQHQQEEQNEAEDNSEPENNTEETEEADKPAKPETIEITVSGGVPSQPIDMSSDIDIRGPGIFWDASERVLMLENVNLKSYESALIKVPVTVDATIVVKGENSITHTKGYMALGYTKQRSGGNLTIKGSGSLKVDGIVHLYGEHLIVDGCTFEAVNTAGGNGENTVQMLGSGGFTAKNGADVTIDGSLNCGSGSDKLLVDGASLTVTGGDEGGYAIQTGSDVSVLNGGSLRIEHDGGKGIEMTRKLLVDQTSRLYIKITGDKGLGIFNDYEADLSLLGKEVYIYGGDKAILAEDLDSQPQIVLADAAAGKYFPAAVQSPFGAEYGYRATVVDAPDTLVEYESYDNTKHGGSGYTYNLTAGVKEISW